MKNKIVNLKIGDYVKVKKGILDPDEGKYNLEDWQGKIINTHMDEEYGPVVLIKWDNITLKNIPESFIIECIQEAFEFSEMWLGADEVTYAECRSNDNEVDKAVRELNEKYDYVQLKPGNTGNEELDKQEILIEEVLDGIDRENWNEVEERWEEYLENNLEFPFKAEVAYMDEYSEEIENGDVLDVKKISGTFDLEGIIVETKKGRYKYYVPLCELEVVDKSSDNYIKVEAYNFWFANR